MEFFLIQIHLLFYETASSRWRSVIIHNITALFVIQTLYCVRIVRNIMSKLKAYTISRRYYDQFCETKIPFSTFGVN